ncbi:MAG TPA: hypothetical protein VF681_02170 [Abditibacteriaceae bacterium]|jgi:hypothetical protein
MNNQTDYPRPEYPRPERQRAFVEGVDWLNLNGPWKFRFDGDGSGHTKNWQNAATWPELNEQIIVPFCWESLAAWGEADAAGNDHYYSTRVFRNPLGVNRSNHRSAARYEIGWYYRRICVPRGGAWAGKRPVLTVGAADFFTDCWCNGVHLGHHEGGYTPFEFDLSDALREENGELVADIVFRVEDPTDNHEQPVGKQWQWYTTTSGIWQTVWIEPRGTATIETFRFVPDIDTSSVQFLFNCRNAEASTVEIEITSPIGQKLRHSMPVEKNIAEGLLLIPNAILWDPNAPHLYDVVLRLVSDGVELDRIETYFGMRKIDAAPGPDGNIVLRINSVPRYLRGALYQSYHADGVYTATDVAVLRNDIEAAVRGGFNFLRVHIKIDDPILLHLADRMGMILMCDFPNFGEGGDTPTGRRRYEEMMLKAVERDFNHPSIVAWCLFNETWGFGGQVELVKLFPHLEPTPADIALEVPAAALSATEPVVEAGLNKLENRGSHAWVQNIWELAKSLDSTRLIEDMSVVHWEHLDYYQHGDTDINSWHFYISDYTRAKDHIEKIAAETYAGSGFNYLEGYEQRRQPLINSEYGGVGALDGDVDTSWSFKFLTNELRRQGKISAYIYTELTDVEWEYNGFLAYDRSPKEFGYDPRIINSADVLPIDAPPIARHAPGSTVEIDVTSSHYGTKPRKDVTLHWALSGMDSLGQIFQDIETGHTPIPFPHGVVSPAHRVPLTMPSREDFVLPMLCTLQLHATRPDGEIVARNFVQFFVSDGYPAPRTDRAERVILRAGIADYALGEWRGGTCEREEAREADRSYGGGTGFFEWHIPLDGADLQTAKRLRVICEASSLKRGTRQTGTDRHPTTLEIGLNDLRILRAKIADHPHDARGALSYMRGDKGAHGYLAHATVEGELLQQVASRGDSHLRLRIAVPDDTRAACGLTLYGAECGRFPVPPTIIIEW